MTELNSLDRLLRPKTIAVFGGKEARRVIFQCDKMGFKGEIWPVHPKEDEIYGRKCYRSVADLPSAPDAAFVGVNRNLSVEIVRQLSERGAGGAICYASGFLEAQSELSDGADLQAELVRAAGKMRIIGPNCYGIVNALDGALLWPDQHGLIQVDKGVAILTQSSNIVLNLTMQTRGLPIAYIMTAGNQAQTGLSEMAIAALEDPRVTALGLHIEGIDSVDALERLAERSRELKKPVVALKVGKSEAAQKATVSHTASLAGNHAVSTALLKRLGIGQVSSLPVMLEALKLLHVYGPLASYEVSSMSCSGGEASLVSDTAVGRKVNFRALKDFQLKPMRESLGEMVTLANPLDYHTFVWGNLERQTAAFTAMFAGGYALNMIILDFPRADRCTYEDWWITVQAMQNASRANAGVPAAFVASLPENMHEDVAFKIMEMGMVPLCGIDEALSAAEIAADIGAAWRGTAPLPLLKAELAEGDSETLSEADAKRALAAHGVPVPEGVTADTPEAIADAAEKLGFPVALKGLGVAHKTEAGAVKLNLASREAVLEAAKGMAHVAQGYLAEKMVGRPVAELIIGATHDPVAGPVLTVGAGGILVELIEDAALLTLPTTEAEIRNALSGLKIARLLGGYRGQAKGDMEALVQTVAAAAAFVTAEAGRLEELDINPVMVLPEGQGAVAADALIRRKKA